VTDDARRSRLPVVLALVLGLAAGLGAALFLGRGGDDPAPAAPTSDAPGAGDREDLLAELPEPDPLIDVADATDAEAGLRGFLAAEAAREWERSWTFLAPEQQEVAYPTPALWVSQHANVPTITGYRVDEVTADEEAGTATATTLTAFEAKLDPVLGLVPGRGRTSWSLVRADDGTWRVDPTATRSQPLYPDDDGAAGAAQAWVDARTSCEDPGEVEADLVGSPALAELLCDEEQPADLEVGPVGTLEDSAATSALLARFGPEVFSWARQVRVEAATPLLVVLGPVGLEWRVVGVLPA
jgi:hypothetical protein